MRPGHGSETRPRNVTSIRESSLGFHSACRGGDCEFEGRGGERPEEAAGNDLPHPCDAAP